MGRWKSLPQQRYVGWCERLRHFIDRRDCWIEFIQFRQCQLSFLKRRATEHGLLRLGRAAASHSAGSERDDRGKLQYSCQPACTPADRGISHGRTESAGNLQNPETIPIEKSMGSAPPSHRGLPGCGMVLRGWPSGLEDWMVSMSRGNVAALWLLQPVRFWRDRCVVRAR